VANFFLDQSIGIVETNTFQLKSSIQIVGVTGFRGLWALKWAWQTFFWVNRLVLMRTAHFS